MITKIKSLVAGNSKFTADVLWSVSSLFVIGVTGILCNVVIGRYSTAQTLGVFNQVFAVYLVVSQLAVGGIHASTLKHVSYAPGDKAEVSRIVCSALLLVAGLAFVISLLTLAARHLFGGLLGSYEVESGIILAVPGLFAFAINKVLLSAMNGERRMRAYSLAQIIRGVLILTGVTALVVSNADAHVLPLSLSLAEVILLLGLWKYARGRVFDPTTGNGLREWFLKHLSFGFRGMFSGLLTELNTRVDILILGFFLTDSLVGVFSFASIIAEGFSQLPVAMRWNIDPILGGYFAKKEADKAWRTKISEASLKLFRYFAPVMALLALVATLLYLPALRVLGTDPEFEKSWGVFAILATGIVINSTLKPLIGIFLQGGRPGAYTFLVLGVVLTNIALNFILVPLFGIYGAALATSATFVAEAVAIYVLAEKLFGVRFCLFNRAEISA